MLSDEIKSIITQVVTDFLLQNFLDVNCESQLQDLNQEWWITMLS